MRLTLIREALLTPLQLVAGVVDRRLTIPVLGNLLLDVGESGLRITGSNNEIEISVLVRECSADGTDATTVPARKLHELWRNIPAGAEIELDFNPGHLGLSFDRFKSSLATIPAFEFPLVTPSSPLIELALPAAQLRTLIERCRFAMAQQDVRYFLNGMLFELEEGLLRVVATNGQRLASSFIAVELSVSSARQFIIPGKSVAELARVLAGAEGEVRLLFSENHVRAIVGDVTLTSGLIDGKYPDYQRAIPGAGVIDMEGDRRELRDALARTAILSNDVYHQVNVALRPGELTFRASNSLQEEAQEDVAAVYDGEDTEMAFNLRYLLDVMDVMVGDRFRLQAAGVGSPALLTDPADAGSLFVVSPMVV